MRLTLRTVLLAVVALDVLGFALIVVRQPGWGCLVFGAAAAALLGLLLLCWRDL